MPTRWTPKSNDIIQSTPRQQELLENYLRTIMKCQDICVREYEFMAGCGCYREYTLEPPSLRFEVYNIPPEQLKHTLMWDSSIREWAEQHLEWDGCSGCLGELSLWVSYFGASQDDASA